MSKKCAAVLLAFLLAATAVGCAGSQNASDTGGDLKIALDDYTSLGDRFVNPLLGAQMLYTSWETAEQIAPQCFVYFYTALVAIGNRGVAPPDNASIPAQDLEAVVQQYFAVATETIRKAETFDANAMQYKTDGLGGATNCDVTSATLVGRTLTLTIATNQDLEPLAVGTLTIALGEGDACQYLACALKPVEGAA